MRYEVWIGTPNEMALAKTEATLPAASKWAQGQVSGLRKQAEKFDSSALGYIAECQEGLRKTYSITVGDKRTWTFPYIGLVYRIEIRRTA